MSPFYKKLETNDWFPIKNILKRQETPQILLLYSSMVLGVFLGIGVSVVNTRLLGPELYGDLKFLQSIFLLFIPFFTFGIFSTGARSLAISKNEFEKKNIIGTMLTLGLFISILYIAVLFFASFFDKTFFKNDLGYIVRLTCPLLIVLPLQSFIDQILVGANEIFKLSFYRILPRLFYICIALLISTYYSLNVYTSLFIQLGCILAVLTMTIISLKPKITSFFDNMLILFRKNKSHGLQVYYGTLFSLSSTQLIVILIGYFIDNVNVGYYSLAYMTAMPLALVPNAVGQTYYKKFAALNNIPFTVMLIALLPSLIVLIFYLLVIKKIIIIFYSYEYINAVRLAYLLAIGSTIYGLGDFVNKFIGAHGKGTQIKYGAITIGCVNIVGGITLIKFYGAIGASITYLLSSTAYLLIMLYCYRSIKK